MKNFTFFMTFIFCAFMANAQWAESFGPDDVVKNSENFWPYVSGSSSEYVYSNYDHSDECTYDSWKASIRKIGASSTTAAIGNHVWLAAKPSDTVSFFSISGIVLEGSKFISFKVGSGESGYNTNNLKLTVNGEVVTIPNTSLSTANVMVQISNLPLPADSSSSYVVRFDNLSSTGYRIDDVWLSTATSINDYSVEKLNAYVVDNILNVNGVSEGSLVEIFSITGSKVISQELNGTKISMNGLNNGVYIVRSGNAACKVVL